MYTTDTIAAIATGMSDAGIGIVRISGEEAIAIANRVVKLAGIPSMMDVESHKMHYGHVVVHGEIVDEVMVSVMKAPRSYTAEDTVEINCHGGVLVTNKVLEAVIDAGARLAEPGEYTKRAFLNGRIDLSKAEAVIDVIHAQNEYALKNSMSQLKGFISTRIQKMREQILYYTAFIEAVLDDPEHYEMESKREEFEQVVEILTVQIQELLASSKNGRLLKEGIKTVILGKPNAGKSSLLNVLTGEERAIVTEIAGTTRDVLEEKVMIHGIQLYMMDTAGIRETEDIVEKIGVERAKKYAAEADLILYVVDASTHLEENDYEILELLQEKKAIILLNKTDLDQVTTEDVLRSELQNHGITREHPVIPISAKEEQGITVLEQKIKALFFEGELTFNDQVYLTNMRQIRAITEAKQSLRQVCESLKMGMPEDFLSIDLMNAYQQLGLVIGESVEEDLVNEIFTQFCMGK